MKGIVIKSFVLISLTMMSCNDNSLLPLPEQTEFSSISGKVILQNQTEHSNCLIYIENFDKGFSSDSTGFYRIKISDLNPDFTGTLKIYYYLSDYALDSAKVEIVSGKAKTGALDLSINGEIKTKIIKQLVLQEGRTDEYEYKVGEDIIFTARFTNVSDNILYQEIGSVYNELGFAWLYREDTYFFSLSPPDVVLRDLLIVSNPGGYYEGTVRYKIPVGHYVLIEEGDTIRKEYYPLLPNYYIVLAFCAIKRLEPIVKKIRDFVSLKWNKLHRGNSPMYAMQPNKYKFPIIKVIQ